MSTTGKIAPAATIAKQGAASDPAASAWVSANAGSGKTTVLVRRVLRLMLAGIDPARILCLTYTTAAAANMANRLFGKLADWVRLDDPQLDEELVDALGCSPSADERNRARRLFAEALETPGGLKIQTIHAFCTRVLQSAPFEAGIPAHFEVISETDRVDAIENAVARTLDLASSGGHALRASLDRIAGAVDDQRFRHVIDKALAASAFMKGDGGQIRSLDEISADLAAALAVEPAWTVDDLQSQGLSRIEHHLGFTDALAAVEAFGSAKERQTWADHALAYASDDPSLRLAVWRKVFMTDKGEIRTKAVTIAVTKALPEFEGMVDAARLAYIAHRDRLNAFNTYDLSLSLFGLARIILSDYEAAKRRMSVLDYGDLIVRTRDLFASVDVAWLIYKLDAGLDHLLVDEAQDTSKDQWAILNALTAEFLAGAGQREARLARTIFAVGDEKQSIYGFQGAAPAEFGLQRSDLQRRFRQKGDSFNDVRLNVSFRSTRDIVEAVDAVFRQASAFEGLSSDPADTCTVHDTTRGEASGAVDLWDLIEPDATDDEVVWRRPLDAPERQAPIQRMARAIARTLKTWAAAGQDDLGRAFSPGDALILLPKRKAAFAAIVRALKNEGVPVAGMDRLVLSSHVVVEDLLALARSALLPDDDLTLAVVLKTPFFGLDDDDLLRLAPGRPASLRRALASSPDRRDIEANARLSRIEALASTLGPFAFFSNVLSVMGGRRQVLSRLGSEAADAIDALLVRALEHEQREGPSLNRFIHAIEASSDDVKRDLAVAGGEVRVMTVHGAKGLEAKVVFIADIGMPPSNQKESPLIELPLSGSNAGKTVTVWSPRAADDSAPAAQARALIRQKATEEHHRLLYVALTRAEDRLIICGVKPAAKNLGLSWYGLVESGLLATEAGLIEQPPITGDIGCRRFKVTPDLDIPQKAVGTSGKDRFDIPGWVNAVLPLERVPVPPLAPANALSATELPERATDRAIDHSFTAAAAERGRFVHLLLQWLPSVDIARRLIVAQRLAARHARDMTADEQMHLINQTLAVMASPDVAELFGDASLAEAEIGGSIATADGPRPVSGRIDRLVVSDQYILVADFKTTLRPPSAPGSIAPATLTQLAAYRALLGQIYPGRPVRALVIYTVGPVVLEATGADLDRALATLIGSMSSASQDVDAQEVVAQDVVNPVMFTGA